MATDRQMKWEAFGEFAESARAKFGVPGVAVGILEKDQRWTGGFGITHVENPLPVTGDTLFQIGSITKTFTAIALLQLMETGKLDLNTPIRNVLPEFKVADATTSEQATIRHLLTHLGGWAGDLFIDTGREDDALLRYVERMADLPQIAPLGTVWSYNNAGFAVAGLIIERIAGQRFEDTIRGSVLDPIGLKACHFRAEDVIAERFVVGHAVNDGTATTLRPWAPPACVYPMGGLVTNVSELLSYASFHLGDGKGLEGSQVLSPTALASMQEVQTHVYGKAHWGLPFSVDDVHGVRTVSHGGGMVGQISMFTMIPERQFAFTVLTNANVGNQLITDISKWIHKEYLGIEIRDPAPIDSTEEELRQYVGRYERPFADVEMDLLNGRLVAQIVMRKSFPTEEAPLPPPPPPMTLARCASDRLMILDGPFRNATVDIVPDGDNPIGWVRVSGRILRKTA